MRSQFKSTFQPALGGGRQVALAYPVGRPQLFPTRRMVALGTAVSDDDRSAILDKIKEGTNRMAQVRKWIASRIDADPMLLRTFKEKYVSDNFWGYDDLVSKDQYYVDRAQTILNGSPSPEATSEFEHLAQTWDVDDETLGRVDEWKAAIDIMYAAMQEYGKTPLTTTTGQTIPNTTAPTGGTVPTTTGGGRVPAGANVNTQPPTSDKILGIPKQTFWVGVGSLGIITLALIVKNA